MREKKKGAPTESASSGGGAGVLYEPDVPGLGLTGPLPCCWLGLDSVRASLAKHVPRQNSALLPGACSGAVAVGPESVPCVRKRVVWRCGVALCVV